MSFSLTPVELQTLYNIRYGSSATPYADSYDYLLTLISFDGAPAAHVPTNVGQWFYGAVNGIDRHLSARKGKSQ